MPSLIVIPCLLNVPRAFSVSPAEEFGIASVWGWDSGFHRYLLYMLIEVVGGVLPRQPLSHRCAWWIFGNEIVYSIHKVSSYFQQHIAICSLLMHHKCLLITEDLCSDFWLLAPDRRRMMSKF